MISFICIFYICSAIRAFFCFTSTCLKMLFNIVKADFFIAKFTGLWFLTTAQIMTFKCVITCNETALFTFDFFMFFFFMFIFFRFSNTLITLLTLIILSCTSHVMHSKFGHGNLLLAKWTFFSFFYRLFGFHCFFIFDLNLNFIG